MKLVRALTFISSEQIWNTTRNQFPLKVVFCGILYLQPSRISVQWSNLELRCSVTFMTRHSLRNLSFVTVVCVITSAFVFSCMPLRAWRKIFIYSMSMLMNFASGDCLDFDNVTGNFTTLITVSRCTLHDYQELELQLWMGYILFVLEMIMHTYDNA